MTKSYEDVLKSLRKEEIDVDYDNVPEELGAFREPPQPGSFRFRCPDSIQTCFGDPIEVVQRDAEGNPIMIDDPKNPGQKIAATRQRIQLQFQDANSLIITQSPGGEYDNEPFSTRISNIERNRFAGKGVKIAVSDMTYLLRAKAPDKRPRTNEDFIRTCVEVLPNAEFGADVEWAGFCNPKNDAYFAYEGENGQILYEPSPPRDETTGEPIGTENIKGCERRIYQSKWPKAAGRYAERAQCECGAFLRPFAQLVRFKA